MTKSVAQIMADVWESPEIQKKLKETLELMDNINPRKICLGCGKNCGKEHLLCIDCYIERG